MTGNALDEETACLSAEPVRNVIHGLIWSKLWVYK